MDKGPIRRWLALGLAVLTASGLLALGAPGEARAGSPYCPGHKVRTLPFSTGSVLVYRSRGYVCAVTLPTHPGAKRTMSVSVRAWGLAPVSDEGRYAYHAGPVRVHAGYRCVRVKGRVGRGSVDSRGWILC